MASSSAGGTVEARFLVSPLATRQASSSTRTSPPTSVRVAAITSSASSPLPRRTQSAACGRRGKRSMLFIAAAAGASTTRQPRWATLLRMLLSAISATGRATRRVGTTGTTTAVQAGTGSGSPRASSGQ